MPRWPVRRRRKVRELAMRPGRGRFSCCTSSPGPLYEHGHLEEDACGSVRWHVAHPSPCHGKRVQDRGAIPPHLPSQVLCYKWRSVLTPKASPVHLAGVFEPSQPSLADVKFQEPDAFCLPMSLFFRDPRQYQRQNQHPLLWPWSPEIYTPCAIARE